MRNKNLLLVFLVPIVCVGIALGFGHKAFAADIAGVCSSVLDSFADTTGGGGSDTSGGGGCSDHGCGCYSGVSFAYFKFSNGNGYGSVNGVTMNCGSQYEGVWVMMRRQSGTNCSTRNSLFRVVTIGTASAYGGDADYITGSVSCGSSSKGICGVNATLSGLYTYDYNISLSTVRDKCYEADIGALADSPQSGYAFIPHYTFLDTNLEPLLSRLAYFQLDETPLEWSFALMRSRDAPLTREARAFWNSVMEQYK